MTRMTSSEAFVETPVANGVTEVSGIVGSACTDALDPFPAGRPPAAPGVRAKPRSSRLVVGRELGDPFRRDALSEPVPPLDKCKALV